MIPFDFVEIFGGSGVLSAAAADLGLSTCPPIDLSRSPHHDIGNDKLLGWICQMIFEKRFRSLICEPPCTTFSPAQHPASKSYTKPLGYDRRDPKTFLENLLAFRSFTILWFAWRCGAPSLLETPHLSKMAWLSMWSYLLEIGFSEAVLNSCAFGSPHKKPFGILGWGLDMKRLMVPCPGGHQHVRIEGKFTKPSAVYRPGVARCIAQCFAAALRKQGPFQEPPSSALESVVLNDLLLQGGWSTVADWAWSKPGHINILESRAFVALERRLLDGGGDCRFVALLDSRVAKGAHAKGRSSCHALRPSLLRSCAYQVAGNIHPSFGFAPTRLNTADAPSRDKDFLEPAGHSVLKGFSPGEIATLHARQFSRASANWIRLYLLVVLCLCPGVASSFDRPPQSALFNSWTCALALILALVILCRSQLPHSSSGLSHDFSDAWTSELAGCRRSSGYPLNGFRVGSQYQAVAIWAFCTPPTPCHCIRTTRMSLRGLRDVLGTFCRQTG